MAKLGEFINTLGKRRALGLLTLVLVILTAVLVIFGVPAFIRSCEHPRWDSGNQQEPAIQQPWLLDGENIGNLDIDNNLLSSLYTEALGLATASYEEAKLRQFTIHVSPYEIYFHIMISFQFYCPLADRTCIFDITDTSSKMSKMLDHPTKMDYERVTFDELPWVKNPDWLQFVKRACIMVGPLPKVERTSYYIASYANLEYWRITFWDGVSGREYSYKWSGQGNPVEE
jgi:hypothetical protein